MTPWELLDQVQTPDGLGTLSLHRRGQEYAIRVDGRELMNSRQQGSEKALARLTCDPIAQKSQVRVLVGGLGMGFTLAAALQCLAPDAELEVAELVPQVVQWNQDQLAGLAGQPLDDSRVKVYQGDVKDLLPSRRGSYDAILLDVDNGPAGFTQASNQWLYTDAGLVQLRRSLKSEGVLSVWSASRDDGFTRRLQHFGFQTVAHRVSARSGGLGRKHTIWIAQLPSKASS